MNLLEFSTENINIIFTTSSWTYANQEEVVFLISNNIFEIYDNGNKRIIKSNDIINFNNFRIMFSGIKEIFNFNFLLYSKLSNSDIIILNLQNYDKNNIDKMYSHIKSMIKYFHIPILIFYDNKGKKYITLIDENGNDNKEYLDSIYVFFKLTKNHSKLFLEKSHINQLKEYLVGKKGSVYNEYNKKS